MAYSKGRITYPVSIEDVRRAIGVSSTDVETLCKSGNINPWARYRPIPCSQAANNIPGPLTPAQRIQERYGIEPPVDMFTADDQQAYTNYANNIAKYGEYYIKIRPWGDTHHHRIHDFVKTDANGATTSYGYDHNAKPDSVKVTLSTGTPQGTFYLKPLIPEGQRNIVIQTNSTNARYQFPNDHLWMDKYYKKIYGTLTDVMSVERNEEWLSPIDFMGTSTYNISYASVLRRVLIFRWADSQGRIEGDSNYNSYDAKWRFYNYCTDKVGGSYTEDNRPWSSNKGAWLDLTDATDSYSGNCLTTGSNLLKNLKGKCLFIDCWIQSNSSLNLFPILGFAYEVNITRTSQDVQVDISNVIYFWKVIEDSYTSGSKTYYNYVLWISYNPQKLGLAGELDYAGTAVTNALKTLYDSLTVKIGTTTINLLNASLEYYTNTSGHTTDWFGIECVALENQTTKRLGTYATITATRKGTGISSTKNITIET